MALVAVLALASSSTIIFETVSVNYTWDAAHPFAQASSHTSPH